MVVLEGMAVLEEELEEIIVEARVAEELIRRVKVMMEEETYRLLMLVLVEGEEPEVQALQGKITEVMGVRALITQFLVLQQITAEAVVEELTIQVPKLGLGGEREQEMEAKRKMQMPNLRLLPMWVREVEDTPTVLGREEMEARE